MEQFCTVTPAHRLIHGIPHTAQAILVQTGIWLLTFLDSVMRWCSYKFYMFIGPLQIYVWYNMIWYDILAAVQLGICAANAHGRYLRGFGLTYKHTKPLYLRENVILYGVELTIAGHGSFSDGCVFCVQSYIQSLICQITYTLTLYCLLKLLIFCHSKPCATMTTVMI